MFDREIQTSSTQVLEAKLKQLAFCTNAGEIDLGIRIAKELRYRNRHVQPKGTSSARLSQKQNH